MARCKNCGKANRDGALFCQDCGKPLDGLASGPADGLVGFEKKDAAMAAVAAIPVARDEEPAALLRPLSSGMQGAQGPIDPGPPASSQHEPRKIESPEQTPLVGDFYACEGCGAQNPTAASFCRNCGQNLNLRQRPVNTRISCGHCGQATPAGFMYCQHCGNRILPETAARSPVASRSNEPAKLSPQPPVVKSAPPARPVGDGPTNRDKNGLRGRFVVVRRDGGDGENLPLSGEVCDLGRSTHRCLADDPFLASRHVRISWAVGGVKVRPLDTVNGVFWQLREPYELLSGDVFFVGRELIRFELLSGDERDLPSVSEQGVRVLGSAPRESWGRLRQLTTAAVNRDIWHLSRPEIVLGREEGDIVFPDDEFLSRRHALLSRVGGKVRLEDQNSSNGTYVRLRGDREIGPGDILRLGEQVLRYEP
jgi:ribosomal protein L40E